MLGIKSFSLVLILFMFISSVGLAKAATPEEAMSRINQQIEVGLSAARSGDTAAAQKAYKTYDDLWFEVEESVRAKSKTAYRAIERHMQEVEFSFAQQPLDNKALVSAFEALSKTNQDFVKGLIIEAPTDNAASSTAPSIAVLLEQLQVARTRLASADYAGAAQEAKQFQATWLDVEGQVKTRSASDYTQTENDMALAYSLLSQNSADAKAVLDRMYSRLEPYKNAGGYGIFDATAILLREGLEALLVVVALLTFLKKSGNADKQTWVWGGAAVGFVASLSLAVLIQFLFSSIVNSSNRELIEGTTGLVAAVMLFYVSYWMHSKASAGAWQNYIKQKSTQALAKGSLWGLAILSFLAIFREGAETALFYLGIASSISLSDLLIGLLIGTVALIGLGLLLLVVGVRIPMGPFFTIASLLVFFLCFKFVGMGIHALQVAGILSSSSADYLVANDFLGIFPTWETTTMQLIILAAAAGFVVYERVKNRPTPTIKSGQATTN